MEAAGVEPMAIVYSQWFTGFPLLHRYMLLFNVKSKGGVMSVNGKKLINDVVLLLMGHIDISMENHESPDKVFGKIECLVSVFKTYEKLIFPKLKIELQSFISNLQADGFDFTERRASE